MGRALICAATITALVAGSALANAASKPINLKAAKRVAEAAVKRRAVDEGGVGPPTVSGATCKRLSRSVALCREGFGVMTDAATPSSPAVYVQCTARVRVAQRHAGPRVTNVETSPVDPDSYMANILCS